MSQNCITTAGTVVVAPSALPLQVVAEANKLVTTAFRTPSSSAFGGGAVSSGVPTEAKDSPDTSSCLGPLYSSIVCLDQRNRAGAVYSRHAERSACRDRGTRSAGALAYLLGINALRASEAAAVRIDDYRETLRGRRVLHLIGKGTKPATIPLTVPVLRVLEACRGERTEGPLILRPLTGNPIDRRDCYRMVIRIAKAAGIPRHISPHSRATPLSPTPWTPACCCETPRSWPGTPIRGPPSTTIEPSATSTVTASTSSLPTSPAFDAVDRIRRR